MAQFRGNPQNSPLPPTRPSLAWTLFLRAKNCGKRGRVAEGGRESSGHPRILAGTSCTRQQGVSHQGPGPIFCTVFFPWVSLLPGGMWGEEHGGLASQAASFFSFCRSICLNTFRLTGKGPHSRVGAS